MKMTAGKLALSNRFEEDHMEPCLNSSYQPAVSDGPRWIKISFLIFAISFLGLAGFYALTESLRDSPTAPAIQRHWITPEITTPDVGIESTAASYDNALSRPIFSRERRLAPRVTITGNVPHSHLTPSIFAIVISKKIRKVFMSVDEKSEATWVKIGEKVGDWTLAAIEKNKIEFTEGNDREAFDLYGLNGSDGAVVSPSIVQDKIGNGSGIENRQGRSHRSSKGKKLAYSISSKFH